MTMKSTLAALLLGASILAPVLADEAQEKAIEYRQSVYTGVVSPNRRNLSSSPKLSFLGRTGSRVTSRHLNLSIIG
ncbi:MAG: hypothetical protein B7Y40_00910 [Gammaproteobacteria bacterium 28-57-27]|nr:MAG: hypothetical protein B7Y40_00910 [Gammaproteobacteria bacterium 28-57-27]